MPLHESLLVEKIVKQSNEKRIQAPNYRDYSFVQVGQVCVVHGHESEYLVDLIDAAKAHECQEIHVV